MERHDAEEQLVTDSSEDWSTELDDDFRDEIEAKMNGKRIDGKWRPSPPTKTYSETFLDIGVESEADESGFDEVIDEKVLEEEE